MEKCHTNQAIVLASWEKNSKAWRDGKFFELRSNKRRLQETAGGRGTLWIVVSRPASEGRLYTVSFRLNECQSKTYDTAGKFGRFAVVGDRDRSEFFATADARLLLLALRFDPVRPINGPADNQVSNSLRVPRCLNPSDVQLLEENAARSDRWSVFISYQRRENLELATTLSEALQREGVSVFRDQEGLRGGDKWWPVIQRTISRSQRLVLLIGRTTHESTWVRKEVEHAFDNGVRVIPILSGGDFQSWGEPGKRLSSLHALNMSDGFESVLAGLV
jgi:hypothetical protein